MASDEKIIFDQSWNKIKKSLYSEGYREGSSSGKQLTFQQGFDTGYAEGFQAGYDLGLHSGVLRCLQSDASVIEASIKKQLSAIEEVDQASRGLCVLCPQEREDDRSINSTENDQKTLQVKEIKVMQKKAINEKRSLIMTENYSSVLNSVGLDGLFISH